MAGRRNVAPLAGAWIEIPSRKFRDEVGKWVAPLAGAWIEILLIPLTSCVGVVAPLAGAWIEIGIYGRRP